MLINSASKTIDEKILIITSKHVLINLCVPCISWILEEMWIIILCVRVYI